MPDWPEEEFPTTKQVGVYLLFWEHQRKQLVPDPGAGCLQKSYWLDPEDLEISAYQAECLRAGRPDRALFVRRLIATYHKRRTSRPMRVSIAAVPHPAPATVSTESEGTMRQVLRQVSAPATVREAELSPAQVTRFHARKVSESAGNPEMFTTWERPLMENLVSYRSIYWGGSWLDMVRGEVEKEKDPHATTDSP